MSKLTMRYLWSRKGRIQLKALDKSINVWKGRVNSISISGCPLCQVDNGPEFEPNDDCRACIIGLDTGVIACRSTPYYRTNKYNSESCKIMLRWLQNLRYRAFWRKWLNL